jgi:hypothetical protein
MYHPVLVFGETQDEVDEDSLRSSMIKRFDDREDLH